MHIGVCTLYLSIPEADSLKDKRQVIRSLCAKLRNKFNVSVAEVDDLDIWRQATVAVVVVSNDQKFANQVLSQAVNHVEDDFRAILDDYSTEFL